MTKNKNTHTISVKVANKPGVLVRCAQVFAKRGYNIDSLVVSPGVNPKYSRMTITAQGDPEALEQIIKQTDKLIDVLHTSEHSDLNTVTKEIALVKVKAKSANQKAIVTLSKKFKALIVDKTENTFIVEQVGTTDQLDELEDSLKKYGIIEVVRSGKLVMAIGKEPT